MQAQITVSKPHLSACCRRLETEPQQDAVLLLLLLLLAVQADLGHFQVTLARRQRQQGKACEIRHRRLLLLPALQGLGAAADPASVERTIEISQSVGCWQRNRLIAQQQQQAWRNSSSSSLKRANSPTRRDSCSSAGGKALASRQQGV